MNLYRVKYSAGTRTDQALVLAKTPDEAKDNLCEVLRRFGLFTPNSTIIVEPRPCVGAVIYSDSYHLIEEEESE